MIQLKELTKIYKSRKSGTCVALDHLSFTLPDKGFVFVIGKSGSGKTTLLSLFGGLDTITSGEIVVNGRHIEDFGLSEQVYYRNSTIGFIFQDFHLIDELTIAENIALALELQGEDDREKVQKALADTDLADQGNKYPNELSGGQKQRVAIARALVKQPSIILADEPTGNLDSKTTAQILDLLKELSKEKLVVIVSHNLSDAEHYADEIIELSDGKILRHLKKNENFDARLRVEDDTLVIPYGEEFSKENLDEVAPKLAQGVSGVRQENERFLPYDEPQMSMPKEKSLERKHLKARHTAKLSAKFSRRSVIRTCVYSVIFAVVLMVLGLSQLIMNFNGGEVIANEMTKRGLSCTTFIKDTNDKYEITDTACIVDVNDDDLQKFYDAGYEGKAYPLVNYALFLTSDDLTVEQKRLQLSSNPYSIGSTFGTLVTEESFVEKHFGELEYVALADEQKDYGVFITDFFADACIANRPANIKSYQDLLGKHANFTNYTYGYVNGIIKTGYKERYNDIFDKLTAPDTFEDELKEIAQSDRGIALYDEITQFLGIAYSFEQNFATDPKNPKNFVSVGNSTFEYNGQTLKFDTYAYFSRANIRNAIPLRDNEIALAYDVYNQIFGTSYTLQNLSRFVPHEVKFSYYQACDKNRSNKKFETTLKIVGLNDVSAAKISLPDNVYDQLVQFERITLGYYFENAEQTELLANVAAENGFIPNSVLGSSIVTMSKAVGVFSRFFYLIFGVLCAALFVLMIQFEVKSIKDKMGEIGILKALGARDVDLLCIFGFQIVMAMALMLILYIAGSFLFVGAANRLLVFSLSELAKNVMVVDLTFLSVKWKYILQNCLLSVAILVVSFLAPMLRLRYIKPTNVIKAKE